MSTGGLEILLSRTLSCIDFLNRLPLLSELNEKHGWGLKIHVDGASGGFVAPFLVRLFSPGTASKHLYP